MHAILTTTWHAAPSSALLVVSAVLALVIAVVIFDPGLVRRLVQDTLRGQ